MQQRLGCSKAEAVGFLEMLWHFTARYAPQGDIGRWADENIARGVSWEGDASKFVAALVKTGWLDASKEHRLLVHDWADHIDNSAKKGLQRKGLHVLTLSGQKRDKNGRRRRPVSALPEPEPLPEPAPEPEPISAGAATRRTWLSSYADAWTERYGGNAPHGEIAKTFKPLHGAHGEADVLGRWRRYLAETEGRFASPTRFANTFGEWSPLVVTTALAPARASPHLSPRAETRRAAHVAAIAGGLKGDGSIGGES